LAIQDYRVGSSRFGTVTVAWIIAEVVENRNCTPRHFRAAGDDSEL
jgi:hypothetical protein